MPLRAPDVGNLLTQPQVPVAGTPVPEDNRNLWQKFQERLTTDPNLRMALLTTGLNLLQDPQRGASGFDQFAKSALTGVNTLDALRTRDRNQQTQDSKIAFDQGQAERRTTVAEKGQETRATSLADRLDLANRGLSETIRHNQATEANSRRASTVATTGAERQTENLAKWLMTTNPTAYPDTDEGRALAKLRASGFDNESKDQLSMTRMAMNLASDAMKTEALFETGRSQEEILQESMTIVEQVFQNFGQKPDVAEEGVADNLEGQVFPTAKGPGTVIKLGEDRYRLAVTDPETGKTVQTRVYNRAELEQAKRATDGR